MIKQAYKIKNECLKCDNYVMIYTDTDYIPLTDYLCTKCNAVMSRGGLIKVK